MTMPRLENRTVIVMLMGTKGVMMSEEVMIDRVYHQNVVNNVVN